MCHYTSRDSRCNFTLYRSPPLNMHVTVQNNSQNCISKSFQLWFIQTWQSSSYKNTFSTAEMFTRRRARTEFVLTVNISSLFHRQPYSHFNPPSYFSFFQPTPFRQALYFPLQENGELRDWIPVFCVCGNVWQREMLDALLTSLTLIPQSGFSCSSFTPVSSSGLA